MRVLFFCTTSCHEWRNALSCFRLIPTIEKSIPCCSQRNHENAGVPVALAGVKPPGDSLFVRFLWNQPTGFHIVEPEPARSGGISGCRSPATKNVWSAWARTDSPTLVACVLILFLMPSDNRIFFSATTSIAGKPVEPAQQIRVSVKSPQPGCSCHRILPSTAHGCFFLIMIAAQPPIVQQGDLKEAHGNIHRLCSLTSPLWGNLRSILAQPPFAKWGFSSRLDLLKCHYFNELPKYGCNFDKSVDVILIPNRYSG